MNRAALTVGLLLVLAWPVSTTTPLVVRVAPQGIASAPASLSIYATVESDKDNRGLSVVAESQDYYRSSEFDLDGDRARRTNEIVFRSLPEGQYLVTVTLLGTRGPRAVANRWFTVTPGVGR